MFRRLRSAFFVLLAAAAGAVLGRIALQAREKMEAGEPLSSIEPSSITLRVQDLIPGLVAAFRVKDAPWSWFRIPSWLAAFAVNFGVGALGGDLGRLRAQAERTAFEFAGLDARDFGLGGDYEDAEFTDAPEPTLAPDAPHTPRAEAPGASTSDARPAPSPSPSPWPAPPPNPTTL
ncbi:MAG: hypothetical protein M0R73_09965 [Dehalococcoidia bacterium]|nr:hypothetical protein [Dehalococcoidia bacterium]